jgi:hypothetical protein
MKENFKFLGLLFAIFICANAILIGIGYIINVSLN